ncbi:ATP-binding protein, partial [Desulfobacterota bacterium AH_259_B03_O07]|nr:ATP-binding protein [Desulfobacterota bacterium AH_259_B03_O07]
ASAAKRTANDISKTLQEFNLNSAEILKWYIFKDHVNKEGYPFQPIKDIMKIEGVKLDPIERGDLEGHLSNWLEGIGIDDSWNVSSILVSVGFTEESLKKFTELLVPDQLINFINWLSKDVEMRILSNELIASTNRISDLVTAMKSYSYMDQSLGKSKIDLHKGIDDTLTILNHRIKLKHISIEKCYDNSIPKITASGSELNQVWTNLIHNAIDAVDNEGTITIKTYRQDNNSKTVSVEIIDNGIGIPEEIQNKIFDPFFTTKDPGEGTGLGLDISHRIIVKHHNGSIDLSSKPGLTKFRICLPID